VLASNSSQRLYRSLFNSPFSVARFTPIYSAGWALRISQILRVLSSRLVIIIGITDRIGNFCVGELQAVCFSDNGLRVLRVSGNPVDMKCVARLVDQRRQESFLIWLPENGPSSLTIVSLACSSG